MNRDDKFGRVGVSKGDPARTARARWGGPVAICGFRKNESARQVLRPGDDGARHASFGRRRRIKAHGAAACEPSALVSLSVLLEQPASAARSSGETVRRVVVAGPGSVITTVAGNEQAGHSGDGGPAIEAMLNGPTDIDVAPDGALFIADRANSCVRTVGSDGTIRTVAGRCGESGFSGEGGPAAEALLWTPYGVGLDGKGDLYISDTRNNCIRKVVLP